jgi:hypothetical protein
MARRGKIGLGTVAALAGLAWFVFGRKAAAAPVAASSAGSSSMPAPAPGESSESYADRVEAWGLTTGQMYPTMEGYGHGADREWYSWQANGPKGTLHSW